MRPFDMVLWDIDGTLLHSSGVGRESTRQALLAVFGTEAGITAHRFGGKTDWFTLNELLGAQGFSEPDIAARIPAFSQQIAAAMTRLIADYDVYPLPHTLELVRRLHDEGIIHQGIITGNVAATGAIKLQAAGFDPAWFPFGAYGDESPDRNDLPTLALQRAGEHLGYAPSPSRVLIVGDTVRDVLAARAAGMKVAIVETGYAPPEALRAAQPDWLLPDLSPLAGTVLGLA